MDAKLEAALAWADDVRGNTVAAAQMFDTRNIDTLAAAVRSLLDEVEAALAVLENAKQHDSDITFAAPNVWIQVDRAAWLAWQGRAK
jgi:hypothetical protein